MTTPTTCSRPTSHPRSLFLQQNPNDNDIIRRYSFLLENTNDNTNDNTNAGQTTLSHIHAINPTLLNNIHAITDDYVDENTVEQCIVDSSNRISANILRISNLLPEQRIFQKGDMIAKERLKRTTAATTAAAAPRRPSSVMSYESLDNNDDNNMDYESVFTYTNYKDQVTALEKELEFMKKYYAQIHNETSEKLKQENIRLQTALRTRESNIELENVELSRTIEKHKATIAQTILDLEKCKRTRQEYDDRIIELTTDLPSDMRQLIKINSTNPLETLHHFFTEYKRFVKSNQVCMEEKQKIESQLEASSKRLTAELKAKDATCEKETNALKQRIVLLTNANETFKVKLSDMKKLEREINTLRRTINANENKIITYKERSIALKEQLKTYDDNAKDEECLRQVIYDEHFKDVSERESQLNEERDRLRSQYNTAIQERDAVISQQHTKDQEIAKVTNERDRIIQERDGIMQDRGRIIQEHDAAVQSLGAVTEERNKLMQELAVIQERLTKFQQNNEILQTDLNNLNVELQKSNGQLNVVIEQLKNLGINIGVQSFASVEQLITEIGNAFTTYARLQQRIIAATEYYNKLKRETSKHQNVYNFILDVLANITSLDDQQQQFPDFNESIVNDLLNDINKDMPYRELDRLTTPEPATTSTMYNISFNDPLIISNIDDNDDDTPPYTPEAPKTPRDIRELATIDDTAKPQIDAEMAAIRERGITGTRAKQLIREFVNTHDFDDDLPTVKIVQRNKTKRSKPYGKSERRKKSQKIKITTDTKYKELVNATVNDVELQNADAVELQNALRSIDNLDDEMNDNPPLSVASVATEDQDNIPTYQQDDTNDLFSDALDM